MEVAKSPARLRRSQSLGGLSTVEGLRSREGTRDRPRARDDLDWRTAEREMLEGSAKSSEDSDEDLIPNLNVIYHPRAIRRETGNLSKPARRPPKPPLPPDSPKAPMRMESASTDVDDPRKESCESLDGIASYTTESGEETSRGEAAEKGIESRAQSRVVGSTEEDDSKTVSGDPEEGGRISRSFRKFQHTSGDSDSVQKLGDAIFGWFPRRQASDVRSEASAQTKVFGRLRRRNSKTTGLSLRSGESTASGALLERAYSRTGFNAHIPLVDARREVIKILEGQGNPFQKMKNRFRIRVPKRRNLMVVSIGLKELSPKHCRLEFRRSRLDRERTSYWEFVDWYRVFLGEFRARQPSAVAPRIQTLREKNSTSGQLPQ